MEGDPGPGAHDEPDRPETQGPPLDEELYRVADVAELLHITEPVIRGLIARGELEAYDLGHRQGYRIPERAIKAFLADRRVPPPDEPA